MKKVLFAAAMLLSLQFVTNAQVKNSADSRKAVESALKATEDAKKAAKVATWTKLGEAYIKAWDNPTGGLWLGASETDINLMLGGKKPVSQEMVTVGGETYRKDSYETVDLYIAGYGGVGMIVPTDLAYEDALERAADAFWKAYEVDVKKSKEKDIITSLKGINERLNSAGTNSYMLGDLKKASLQFEKAAEVFEKAPISQIDTNAISNAALSAFQGGDNVRAKALYEKCASLGIEGEGGDVYAKLADIASKLGDAVAQKEYLEKGIAKYPDSQSILIGLINYSMNAGEDPDKVFGYLHEAQENEPNNASLWYVEGNILAEFERFDEAAERFHKAQEIDPNFVYGFIGEGLSNVKQADKIMEAADAEMNQRKYDALIAQYDQKLKDTAVIFEKVVAMSNDPDIKFGISQYLKEIYFRLRSEPEYNALYEKYKAIVDEGK